MISPANAIWFQFQAVFGALADRLAVENTQSQSFTTKAQEAFKYLARFSDNMPEATTAVTLFKTLMRIKELSGAGDSLRSNAHSVVTGILKEDWFDWRNIKVNSESWGLLLLGY